jgi:eukaryotic-like serine/threonine-protein kinase
VQHPEQLGKYRITEVLGEGAMGVVYKGFDPDIKRTVAIKTIRRQFGVAGEGVSAAERFRNEAVAAGRLTHPGIVAVYDFGEHGDVAYIAMEFVEGRTLAHYLSSRVRFTDEDIPGVISQVLDALEHAHDAGVWHRDIKPANIIMAKNGKLKVADFGIARIEDAGLTQANVMIGTPTYMAPEQFLGTSMDRRVDIYAAGVLLYLLLTGRPPFTGPQHELMYKVVHQPPVMPSQIEGMNRPSFYDAILSRALAKNPDDRYPDAASFKADVQRGVGQRLGTDGGSSSRAVGARSGDAGTGLAKRRCATQHRGQQRQLVATGRPLGQVCSAGGRSLVGQGGGAAGQRPGPPSRA